MPPKPLFKIGDILMARDQKKSYLCKVINIDKESRSTKYFVHYNGWNRRWDKWIDESTLSRPAGNSKIDKNGTTLVIEGGELAPGSATSTVSDKELEKELEKANKKRKRDLLMENLLEEEESDSLAIKIPIPFHLQKRLVQEWQVISHEPRHLITLPRVFTVENILSEFLELKKVKTDAEQFLNYESLMKELQLYFDQALPVLLLYRQEHDQFDKEVGQKRPSQVYGAEHLLRLFVRMPKLLLQTAMIGADYNQILHRLAEVIKFIHKNSDRLIGKGQYVPIVVEEGGTETTLELDNAAIKMEGDSI